MELEGIFDYPVEEEQTKRWGNFTLKDSTGKIIKCDFSKLENQIVNVYARTLEMKNWSHLGEGKLSLRSDLIVLEPIAPRSSHWMNGTICKFIKDKFVKIHIKKTNELNSQAFTEVMEFVYQSNESYRQDVYNKYIQDWMQNQFGGVQAQILLACEREKSRHFINIPIPMEYKEGILLALKKELNDVRFKFNVNFDTNCIVITWTF
jgi:hypothetical protein